MRDSRNILRIMGIGILLLVGVNALVGGALLMKDPTGQLIHLPFSHLEYSIFGSYFIPGLILFLALGISGLTIAALAVTKRNNYPVLFLAQGSVIIGWILLQMIILSLIFWLQFVIACMGTLLILIGFAILRRQPIQDNHQQHETN